MPNPNSKLGLLVMHYGTPHSMEEVLPYYTHIRRGRPPTPELLQDLVSRYEAIGGPSPLTAISEAQAEGIRSALERQGVSAKLYIGTKHTHPFVGEAVKQMGEDGIDLAVGLVLAPQFSTYSIAAYKKYAFESRKDNCPDLQLEFLERWGAMPELIAALAVRVKAQLEGWDPAETLVIFSAHSLPVSIVANGDPYQEELMETSRLVAERAGVANWTFAFQSASTTGEPWLGPDILDVITENAPKFKNIVACTVGFVSDHLEVLYDLGIEARDKCAELGLNFHRANTINVDESVLEGIAKLLVPLYRGE